MNLNDRNESDSDEDLEHGKDKVCDIQSLAAILAKRSSTDFQEEDENASDIAFPTELIQFRSSPGAYREGGVGQDNSDDDDADDVDDDDAVENTTSSSGCSSYSNYEGPLISAHLVEEGESPGTLAEQRPQEASVRALVLAEAQPLRQNTRYRILVFVCIVLVSVIALAVGITLALKSKDDSTNRRNNTGTPDLWESFDFRSNHVLLWGESTTCDSTSLPLLNVSCPQSIRVEDEKNCTCELQDYNVVTCRMNTTDRAGVLFSCAGDGDSLPLVGTGFLSWTSCNNAGDKQDGNFSLLTYVSMGRFCKPSDPDDPEYDIWKLCSNYTCCEHGRIMVVAEDGVISNICHDESTCRGSGCSKFHSSHLHITSTNPWKPHCMYPKKKGPSKGEMWDLARKWQLRSHFLKQHGKGGKGLDETNVSCPILVY